MPKIRTERLKIAGEWATVAISYNEKNMFHISGGLPEQVASLVSTRDLSGHATEAALLSALHAAKQEYEAKLQTEQLVLIVEAQVGALAERYLGWNYQTEHPLRKKWGGSGRVEGFGFSFEFCIARQFTTGARVEHRQVPKEQRGVLGEEMPYKILGTSSNIVLPYTAERAAFLLSVQNASVALCQKLADFFPADTEQMLLNMDRGGSLLLPAAQ